MFNHEQKMQKHRVEVYNSRYKMSTTRHKVQTRLQIIVLPPLLE